LSIKEGNMLTVVYVKGRSLKHSRKGGMAKKNQERKRNLLSFEGMKFPVSVQRKYPLLSIPLFVVGLLQLV